ncbi:hypothetical protein CCM_07078 [Cordyceps militaris CM01]|uniref:Uncharacterized protein n=1 Tax=Cordyceps militaris (strain CM01) TaxID=983644 RepID=G3JLT4_CORMM|nr:uncharacterized protein CCM_07078 [Cordyceps militaris CM01]EGX90658.1 hypothetical protein CCM_07078 [Cordyceps militaris CM01]
MVRTEAKPWGQSKKPLLHVSKFSLSLSSNEKLESLALDSTRLSHPCLPPLLIVYFGAPTPPDEFGFQSSTSNPSQNMHMTAHLTHASTQSHLPYAELRLSASVTGPHAFRYTACPFSAGFKVPIRRPETIYLFSWILLLHWGGQGNFFRQANCPRAGTRVGQANIGTMASGVVEGEPLTPQLWLHLPFFSFLSVLDLYRSAALPSGTATMPLKLRPYSVGQRVDPSK